MEQNNSIYTQKLSAADFKRIRSEVYNYCGINISAGKQQMVEGRLRTRIRALGQESFTQYCKYVFDSDQGEDEFVHFVDAITTNKTEFFREPVHFSYLQQHLLPSFLDQQSRHRRPIRIWSSACSTGMEPYSLAIELAEFNRLRDQLSFEILGTDISTKVLSIARRGVYSEEAAVPIPFDRKKRYLLKSKNRTSALVRIAPEIRRVVKFSRLNLNNQDYGINDDIDIIFCRNVIIYFDAPTQEAILRRLIMHLRKGGFLFLGHSETIHGMDLPVRPVAPTIYERV